MVSNEPVAALRRIDAERAAVRQLLAEHQAEVPPADLFVVRHPEEATALERLGITAVAVGAGSMAESAHLRAAVQAVRVVALVDGAGGEEVRNDLHYMGKEVRELPRPYGFRDLLAWCQKWEADNVPAEIAHGFWLDHASQHEREVRTFGPASSHPWRVRFEPRSAFAAAWQQMPADFLERQPKPRRWLLSWPNGDGFLPLERCGLLASEGGVGKTLALLQLAVCVITGRRFLDAFDVAADARGGRVLMALAEEDADEVERRLHSVARALELDADERQLVRERLVVLPLAGNSVALLDERGNDSNEAATLRRLLVTNGGTDGWRLVALDPLSRFAGLSTDKDNAAATRVVQAFESLVDVPGRPTVLVAAHSSKAARTEGRVDVRGASGLPDGFRWVSTLAHHEVPGAVQFRQTKSNYSKPMPDPLVLQRTELGAWRMVGATELALLDGGAAARKAAANAAKVDGLARKARHLVAQGREVWTNREELAASLGVQVQKGRQAVRHAFAHGWITKDANGTFRTGTDPDAEATAAAV
jgi:hypothetical protein